jgi:hypothetical protein
MTPDEVRQIVEREIGNDWTRRNAHGCDLRRCLVQPRMREFQNHVGPGAGGKITLWVVLEERPDTQDE